MTEIQACPQGLFPGEDRPTEGYRVTIILDEHLEDKEAVSQERGPQGPHGSQLLNESKGGWTPAGLQ